MDGGNAELFVNEFVDVGHGEFGASNTAVGATSNFIAVRAADGVSMMSIGNNYWVCGNSGRYLVNSLYVSYTFDAVHYPKIVSDFAEHLGWFCKQG